MRLWLIIVLLTSSYSFQLRSQEQPSPSATSTRPCISPHIVWIFSVIILCHVAGLVNRRTERNSGPDRRLSTTALDNPWRSIMETISSGMSSGILNTLYSNRIISTAKTFRCANGFNNINACTNGFNKPVAKIWIHTILQIWSTSTYQRACNMDTEGSLKKFWKLKRFYGCFSEIFMPESAEKWERSNKLAGIIESFGLAPLPQTPPSHLTGNLKPCKRVTIVSLVSFEVSNPSGMNLLFFRVPSIPVT